MELCCLGKRFEGAERGIIWFRRRPKALHAPGCLTQQTQSGRRRPVRPIPFASSVHAYRHRPRVKELYGKAGSFSLVKVPSLSRSASLNVPSAYSPADSLGIEPCRLCPLSLIKQGAGGVLHLRKIEVCRHCPFKAAIAEDFAKDFVLPNAIGSIATERLQRQS